MLGCVSVQESGAFCTNDGVACGIFWVIAEVSKIDVAHFQYDICLACNVNDVSNPTQATQAVEFDRAQVPVHYWLVSWHQ